jgi:hypothetical protein
MARDARRPDALLVGLASSMRTTAGPAALAERARRTPARGRRPGVAGVLWRRALRWLGSEALFHLVDGIGAAAALRAFRPARARHATGTEQR